VGPRLLSPDELKVLDVESTRTIDLSTFVPRAYCERMIFS
jgi:non-homologous end joining protein Ku